MSVNQLQRSSYCDGRNYHLIQINEGIIAMHSIVYYNGKYNKVEHLLLNTSVPLTHKHTYVEVQGNYTYSMAARVLSAN
jgi:hypothetical protein